MVHAGYRCPDQTCSAHRRTYRSSRADALALPSFTFGLDVVLLVGRLPLGHHQTLDETHRQVLSHLAPLGVSISRREVLYLFDAYCTLLRVGTNAKEDEDWQEQVKQNGGIIVSMDGIQPDKGNETIYLVCDALSGRVLSAANVTFSGIAMLKEILAVLDDYALGMQTALHFDGLLPFAYPGLASAEAFEEVSTSLEQVEKKGGY